MTKRAVQKYLNKRNWRLSSDLYDRLYELSGDAVNHGCYFDRQFLKEVLDEDELIHLKGLTITDIKNELFVRSLLDGSIDILFFG